MTVLDEWQRDTMRQAFVERIAEMQSQQQNRPHLRHGEHMARKSVRITKVNLSDLIRQQHGQVEELESAYAALQGSLTISTEKDRAAAEAEASASMIRAQANMAAAQAQSSFLAFLRLGSAYSTLVATERNWLPPFRNSDGDICIENPFTLRDQRVAARVMHSNLAKQGGDDDSNLDIFEEDDNERS